MKQKKKSDKPAEDKRAKFKRVVTPRVKKALKFIKLIGNQSGSAYTYTEDDVTMIIGSLRDAVDAVEKRYRQKGTEQTEQVDFTLD